MSNHTYGTAKQRYERRYEEAQTRAKARENRSPEAQLALLDTRPGQAKRERARLSS